MILKAVIIFLIFWILSYFAGSWAGVIMSRDGQRADVMPRLAFGGCLVLLEGMIICLAGAAARLPGTVCAYAFIVLAALTGAAGIIKDRGIKHSMQQDPSVRIDKWDLILFAAVLAAVSFQVYAVLLRSLWDTPAMRGIGAATAVFEKGTMAFGDPLMLLLGSLASLTGIHPLTVIFTLSPAVLISLYNICCCEVIRNICDTKIKALTAYVAVFMLGIWGYQSDGLIGVTMLMKWFCASAFTVFALFNVAAFMIIGHIKAMPEKEETDSTYIDDDIPEEWDMKNHRIINARNLAIGLGVITIALIGGVFVLNSKINRLHDATVNLQSDMDKRVAVYEFAPEEGDTLGYLIKGSDGKLTFVGGGGPENAARLSEFLEKYGTQIDIWYVYGEDESDSGAARSLISSGEVSADKVYVINREEMEDLR